MILPFWIQKTVSGTLICFFCGSAVVQASGAWFCKNLNCEKHHDLPAENQPVSYYWNSNITLSGISISPSPSFEISSDLIEGGEN